MLHRLEQLAPFPAMSVAVVCSVDAQGDVELRPSFKILGKRRQKLPLKRHMSNERNLRCLGYTVYRGLY